MEDVLKMDIFFVVATVVTVLIGAVIVVALVQAVRLLKTLNRIGEEIAEETEAIRQDIKDARKKARSFALAGLAPLFGKAAKRVVSRAKRKKKED